MCVHVRAWCPSVLDSLVCESCVRTCVSDVASIADSGFKSMLVKGLLMACHSDSGLLLQLHIVFSKRLTVSFIAAIRVPYLICESCKYDFFLFIFELCAFCS